MVGLLYVPGLGLALKMSRVYYVLMFFGGTPENSETTGQPHVCLQQRILRHQNE